MTRLTLHAPAKVNLFLAITGPRSDGFHNLVSLAVPLDWGDELELNALAEEAGGGDGEGARAGETRLRCEAAAPGCEVSASEDNLVLRAAAAFRAATGFARPVEFVLKKHVPVGAGLGGGSSDAVAALRGLNALAAKEEPSRALDEAALLALAAQLGADCAFFVHGRPAIMRGRGERVTPLLRAATPASAGGRAHSADSLPAAEFLAGQRLFLCKPAFGVNTAWAYGEMRARARAAAAPVAASARASAADVYLPEAEAEALCAKWSRPYESGNSDTEPSTLFPPLRPHSFSQTSAFAALTLNTMEPVVFAKYSALPVLASEFRERFGLTLRMSGSGSACFAFLPTPEGGAASAGSAASTETPAAALAVEHQLVEKLIACVHELWGPSAFTRVVQIGAETAGA